jgi:hypothetical protein
MCELLLAHGADPNGFVDAAGNSVFAARTNELRALMIAHGGTIDPYDLVWMDEDDEVMRRVTEDPESAHAGCGGVYTAVVTRGSAPFSPDCSTPASVNRSPAAASRTYRKPRYSVSVAGQED